MRVIAPFTARQSDAERALREWAPDAEGWDVSQSNTAYAQLVENLWASGEDFLIVEHDIEINPMVLDQALHCECDWGVSPYKANSFHGFNVAPLLTCSLGFTRFRAPLLKAFPDAVTRANAIDGGSICPPGDWKQLDGRLHYILTEAGYTPHLHDEVVHHHVYEYGCSCGKVHAA